jgi:hypothetical protein
MRRPVRCGLTLAVLVAALAGCSSPAERAAITPQNVVVAKQHLQSVTVRTAGGSETGVLDSSSISDTDLKAAIEDAVLGSRLFKTVIQGKGGDYELNVQIVNLRRPLVGASLSVEMETGWSLTRSSDRSVVLRKAVRSTGNATMGEAFAFVTRLRLAVEKAARDNISQGLQAIGELDL